MALSPALSDFGSGDSVVDRRIGTAFSYVQVVANNIAEVKYVDHYMEAVVQVANALTTERTVLATGTTVANPGTTTIPYPSGVSNANLRASTVIIMGTGDTIYHAVPDNHCVWNIDEDGLHLTLANTASADMVGGQIRWHITYGDIP